jgi:pimeloyl-ACP methyl ester carboxylesterase
MRPLERTLSAWGYRVVNLTYPANREAIQDLAQRLHTKLAECCAAPSRRVHFVTHSLGGIVLRYYLKTHRIENLGRVVMLSPPNGGSELVDLMGRLPVVRQHLGPSRRQLSTDASSLPAQLGPVDFELGVITGNWSWNPVSSWVIPGPDDGKVSVERAKVAGMNDFLVVAHSHTFIMSSPSVIAQTLTFLREGKFEHRSSDRLGD